MEMLIISPGSTLDACHINGVLYATALGLLEMLAVCLCSMYICRGFVGIFKRTTCQSLAKFSVDLIGGPSLGFR